MPFLVAVVAAKFLMVLIVALPMLVCTLTTQNDNDNNGPADIIKKVLGPMS